MIVEIIDSILSKTSNGASGNDAFIQTFQELGILGEIQYDYEQKMGKYCTFSSVFYSFLYQFKSGGRTNIYIKGEEIIGEEECEDFGILYFNEAKDWKHYMPLVQLLAEFKEYELDEKRRQWADKIWEESLVANLPPILKKCKLNWSYDTNGVICIAIGCSNYTWTSEVDPFVLYPVVPLNEETAEIVELSLSNWSINNIDIMNNIVQINAGDQCIDFELFNEYQLNWTDAQLAEHIKVLQEFVFFPPF